MQRVAELSGVSIATVSRVVNGYTRVSDEARKQVYMAMEQIGYQPKVPQRNANQNIRTGYVAMLQPGEHGDWIKQPSMLALINGTIKALAQHGMNLVLPYMEGSQTLPPMVTEARVDGVIVLGQTSPRIQARLKRMNAVQIFGGVYQNQDHGWTDWVTPDYMGIGRLAAEHLVRQGCRQMFFLNPVPKHMGYREIEYSFCLTCERAGVAVQTLADGPDTSVTVWDVDTGRRDVEHLLERLIAQRKTSDLLGILVTDDEIAYLLYQTLGRRNLVAGKDFIVVAKTYGARALSKLQPQPVAITIDHEALAARAVERLMNAVNHRDTRPSSRILIAPVLTMPEG
jgi:DNA-binding LacI/PurR family transcriptional regulator